MIIKESSKLHPEFDFEAATTMFANEAHNQKLSGRHVTSPFDLYSVETLRDRHNLRLDPAVPTDIFVFGKGEASDPSTTKIGGVPFWPVNEDWPEARGGGPCYFLAQFNFTDSLDIVGDDLPEMVLLILADSKSGWFAGEERLSFEWVSIDIDPDPTLKVPTVFGNSGPFFGAIHRTADYPYADYGPDLDIRQGYNLPSISGTKIGGDPNFAQGDCGPEETRFLCQLGSIQAACNVPYPWVNHQTAYGFDESCNENNEALIGDMGSIHLFIDEDGDVYSSSDTH